MGHEKRTDRIALFPHANNPDRNLPRMFRLGESLGKKIRKRADANFRTLQDETLYLLQLGLRAAEKLDAQAAKFEHELLGVLTEEEPNDVLDIVAGTQDVAAPAIAPVQAEIFSASTPTPNNVEYRYGQPVRTWMTAKDVARRCGINRYTLAQWMEEGKIAPPAKKFNSKQYIWEQSDLERVKQLAAQVRRTPGLCIAARAAGISPQALRTWISKGLLKAPADGNWTSEMIEQLRALKRA